ncbi:MAG TPA: CdaR family protein [Chloroflexota bacterium]|nr:CdaR family protein [Chloroflexota bacterium]
MKLLQARERKTERRWLAMAGRALIAVVLASVTWMLVTWEQNPFREGQLPNPVPVELAHLPANLVQVGTPQSVRVSIRASQDSWSRLQPSDFKASVDTGRLSAGIHSLDVQVTSSAEYQILDWQPRRITVHLEPLLKRTVSVQLDATGKLPDGFRVTTETVTPDHVTLSGAQGAVQSVSRVAVNTTLDGVRSAVTESLQPTLVDSQGQPVTGVQVDPASVLVVLGVEQQVASKTVPVTVPTVGQVANGYVLTALTVAPPSVTISGAPAALSSITSVEVPPLDLGGATGQLVRSEQLPTSNTYFVSGNPKILVTAAVAPLIATETLPVNVAAKGEGSGLQATISPPIVQVTVRGGAATLASLRADSISATVDATGLSAGSQTVSVKVAAPSLQVLGVQPGSVTLTLASASTSVPTSTPTPAPSPQPSATPASSLAARSALTSSSPHS